MAGEKQGETVVATRPWLRGRVADAHKGIREICLYLTGKAQSVLERFFYDRMAAAETQKNAANHAERVAFEAQLKELGLTVFDLARWETKFASQKFRMQTGVDQQGEPVFEDRPFTQRISEWMNLWNARKDEDVVTHLDRTGIKNWADRGKLHEGNVLSFGKNNGLAARATLQAACRAVLSERQIKLADYMFERANDAQRREMLNAISRWEFGSDAANMTARWARLIDRAESPMVSAADTLDVLKNGGQAEFDTGFLNKRINHAQPSLMRSVFDVFFEDVNRANSYIHMRMPVLNAIRLLGYKGQNGANIQTDIETRMGKQVYHFLLNQVARSAGYYKVEPKAFDRVVGRIASNAAVAILWGRITSVLNNRIGGSILMISELWQRYGANVALKYLARMALPPGVTRLSSACRNAIAKLNTLSGFLGVRWNEHYRAAVGNFLENAEASEGNNVRAVAWRKFQEWGLKPMEWAEQRNAADAFLALTGSGVSEEEAVRAVEQLTRDTQNTSSALDESQFSQAIKESRLLWFLFPFFSQNAIAGRLFQRDLLKWTAAKGVQAKAIASKNLALTTVGLAASAAAAALISSLFRAAMRGETWPPDDEHAQLQQVANAAGNLADNLLPGSGRLFDVAQSAIQRGEYQDPSMIGRILDSGISGIHKLATADEISMDDPKFFDGATRLLEALTMLGGIPFGGPYQSVKVAAGLSGAPLVASSTSTPAGSSRSRGVLPPRYVPPRPPVRRALPPRMPPPPRRQS
ncbi:MAG: hypothetical protein NTY53_24620 [Kiritimatiellaeota bacterium]|nr:hypothetical protein [Kiritimatiellota bacterium]